MDSDVRRKFLDLIMENLQYSDYAVQQAIPEFYVTWLELQQFHSGSSHYEPSVRRMDRLFFGLTRIVFLDYVSLSKQLKLPTPAMPPLPNDS